jgi:hypothetical protein
MRTVLAMLLLLPIISLGAEFRVELGMVYQEATNSVSKNGGTNITSNVGWLYQRPHKWSFWELRDYGAVVLLLETDGKITHLSYWSAPDFNDPARRAKVEKSIRSFQLDTTKRKLSFEKAPDQNSRPNQSLQPTGSRADARLPVAEFFR